MRRIEKGQEPHSLTTFRRGGGRMWEDYHEKQDARRKLCTEQGGLCCFCQSRIRSGDKMKIAHFWPRNSPEGEQHELEWSNLFGACMGGERGSDSDLGRHCDTQQGNARLHERLRPTTLVEGTLSYTNDGRITSDDPEVQRDIGIYTRPGQKKEPGKLNLNLEKLRRNRVQAKDVVTQRLSSGKWAAGDLDRAICELDAGGELVEFCDFLLWWLRRRRRAGDR